MYQTQTFNIPELKGISKHTIEEHFKLYTGYVKFANTILEKIQEYKQDSEKNAYALAELQRRFSFEFNGMRNHEYYFKSLESGAKKLSAESELGKAIKAEFGSFDAWLSTFITVALTRGIGWAIMYYDPNTKKLTHAWVDEHHVGHLGGLPIVLALDMWEHAFIFDYSPTDKRKYITAFFENLNWSVIEKNYLAAQD
jgi:superoxide dismutase, Fe-Mn family